MRILPVIVLLLFATTAFAQDKAAPPPNLPKIAVGMQYDDVTTVLQKSKWEKLDDQENQIKGGFQRIVTYKWDTVGLTVVKKYMHSRVVLTFINNKLIRIDRYSKDKELLDQNVQELYIW